MDIDRNMIDGIVKKVLENLNEHLESAGQYLFDTPAKAIEAAKTAQKRLSFMPLEERGRIIESIRNAARKNARNLAEIAYKETGYGRVSDKIVKNTVAADLTPGIEDLVSTAYRGDYGLTLVEMAPFGVIASVTPSTNPTSSVINNAISMIAAGNAVVFNPHPSAKKCSQEAIKMVNEAVVAAGGPNALVSCLREPSLEGSLEIMRHPDVRLLSVTGGEAVVKVAMGTGKKVIAAGPGNPPVIVDDTANIKKAAKDIVDGASFDNCVLCVAEKEVFVFDNVADRLMEEMVKNGAFLAKGEEVEKICRTALVQKDGKYTINRKYVGKDAGVILRDSGVSFAGEPRLVIADVELDHPFVMVEMLMPVMGINRVPNIDEAIRRALYAEGGCKHSAMIHSTNIKNLTAAAKALNTTIFVKNASSAAGFGVGGEGYTTLTIATPTGEGLTSAKSFTRARRCVLYGDFGV
jgi:acyl-CoA reductase-like NAD-dependent aldehyde dehydrogenase